MEVEVNKQAIENVKDHIITKMDEAKNAEQQAIRDGRIQSQIDMYHDQFCLWAGFLAQLD